MSCGALRTNKKYLPQNLVADKTLERGDFDYRVSESDIVVYKWHNNRPVHVISNFHCTDATTIKRKNKDGIEITIASPSAVKDYNSYVGGVDKANTLISHYGTSRKSKKWWHHIFFGVIDRALCNAYVAYQKVIAEDIRSFNFRRSVAQLLITLGDPLKVGRPLSKPLSATKRRKSNYSAPASKRRYSLACI